MASIKPIKPEAYNGKRDFLAVSTWLYKMEQYLNLAQALNPDMEMTEAQRITFASTFFTGPASTSWYTLVQSNTIPETWQEFKQKVGQEFVPSDHVRRARDKLRNLKHSTTVAKYLMEFRNTVLTIPEMHDGEKWDRFISGLKKEVRLEVLTSNVPTFEEAAKVALRVDGAIIGAEGGAADDGPTPMEVGNMRGGPSKWDKQKQDDFYNNRCFSCHKKDCRPWKCGKKKSKANVNNNEAKAANEKPENEGSVDENASSGSEN